jgi:hypothetical protein
VGFVQNVTITQQNSVYAGSDTPPNIEQVSSIQGESFVDSSPTVPWYNTGTVADCINPAYIRLTQTFGDTGPISLTEEMSDWPRQYANSSGFLNPKFGDPASKVNLVGNFSLYLAVQSFAAGAGNVFTARADAQRSRSMPR